MARRTTGNPKTPLNARLRQSRLALRLSAAEMMQAAGLSAMELHDLEAYKDELLTVYSLAQAHAIAAILDFDLIQLLQECGVIGRKTENSEPSSQRPHRLISTAQLEAGLSDDELADQIGFETMVVRKLKRAPSLVQTLPIHVVIDLAKTIRCDPRLLLDPNRPA